MAKVRGVLKCLGLTFTNPDQWGNIPSWGQKAEGTHEAASLAHTVADLHQHHYYEGSGLNHLCVPNMRCQHQVGLSGVECRWLANLTNAVHQFPLKQYCLLEFPYSSFS